MDSDDFFGFDTTHPDLGSSGDREDDEDFDALNDETFGTAANTGDWEHQHRQLSGLRDDDDELSRSRGFDRSSSVGIPGCNSSTASSSQLDSSFFGSTLNNGLSRLNLGGNEGPSQSPFSSSLNTPPRTATSLIDPVALSESPGNSIWAPDSSLLEKIGSYNSRSNTPTITPNLFLLQQQASMAKQQQMSSLNNAEPSSYMLQQLRSEAARGGMMPHMNQGNFMHRQHAEGLPMTTPPGLQLLGFGGNVKSVADLEMELKLQQIKKNSERLAQQQQQQQVFRAEDLERQSRNNQLLHNFTQQQQQQFFSNQQQQPQQHNSGPPQLHPLTGLPLNTGVGGNNRGGVMSQNNIQYQQQLQHQQHLLNVAAMNNRRVAPNNGKYNNYHNFPNNNQQRNYNNQEYYRGGGSHNNMYSNGFNGRQGSGYNDHRNGGNSDYDRRNNRRDVGMGGNNYGRPDNYDRGHRQDGSNGGGRVRRDSEAEWEEWERIREQDEYAGLMTPRQKKWLRNIQTMQLQTDNPYRDDYYFVMLKAKQKRTRPDEPLEIEGINMLLPVIDDSSKDNDKTYQPPAMENSLGKLQVASVNAPRKIMDLDTVHLTSSKQTSKEENERKTRRLLLLTIEKLYGQLMELEDLDRKISYLPDSPTRDDCMKRAKQLAAEMWKNISSSQSKLVDLLTVRKGKTLVATVLQRLPFDASKSMLMAVLSHLPLLTARSRPHEHNTLNILWPAADKVLASASADVLLELAGSLLPHLKQKKTAEGKTGSSTNSSLLHPVLESKFGISVVVGLLVRGEHVYSDVTKDNTWQEFLSNVIAILADVRDTQLITNTLVRDSNDGRTSSDQQQPVMVLSRGQSLSSLKQQRAAAAAGNNGSSRASSSTANGKLTPPLPLVAVTAAGGSLASHPSVHLARCSDAQSGQLAAAQSTLKQLDSSSFDGTGSQS